MISVVTECVRVVVVAQERGDEGCAWCAEKPWIVTVIGPPGGRPSRGNVPFAQPWTAARVRASAEEASRRATNEGRYAGWGDLIHIDTGSRIPHLRIRCEIGAICAEVVCLQYIFGTIYIVSNCYGYD